MIQQMAKFKVGDTVRGITENYGITDTKMTAAKVIRVYDRYIEVKILEHENFKEIGHTYSALYEEDFELVDYLSTSINEENLKKLKKEELIKLIMEHQKQYNQDYNELIRRIDSIRKLLLYRVKGYTIEDRFGEYIKEDILRESDIQQLEKILDGDDENE